MHRETSSSQTRNTASEALVVDDFEGKADQDWRKGYWPCTICTVSDSRGGHFHRAVPDNPLPDFTTRCAGNSGDGMGTTASNARIGQSFRERSVLNQGNRGQVPSIIQNPRPRMFHRPPRSTNDGLTAPIVSIILIHTLRRWSPVRLYGKSRIDRKRAGG